MPTHRPTDDRGLQRLSGAFSKPLALDTETTSLNWYELECEGISLANETDVIWIAGEFLTPSVTSLLDKLLTKCPELVMHNAPFDLAVLHKLGIFYTGNVFCTQTAAHLLDEEGAKSLKDLAAQKLKVKTKKYDEVQYLKRDSEEFVQYACNDAVWTYQLYKLFQPQLTEQGLDRLFYKIEMPFQFVLKDMKVVGIEANPELSTKFERELEQKEFELLQNLHDAAGLKYSISCDLLGNKTVDSKWNFNSPQQLVDIIQNKLGLLIPFTTDAGEPSVGKDTKKALRNHKFIQILDLYSRCSKLLTGFIRPFKNYVDGDNRIRGDFNNTVTVTGRLSSSRPNLQNLAKDSDDLNVKVRECFTAKEGYVLIAGDFCFSDDTEVLTEGGFKLFRDVLKNEKIAQYDGGKISFSRPTRHINKQFVGNMVWVHGTRGTDLLMTPNHKCLLYNREGLPTWRLSQHYKQNRNDLQVNAGILAGGRVVNDDQLRLVAAIQADGKVDTQSTGRIVFWLKKQTKINRLRTLLERLEIPYKTHFCPTKAAGHGTTFYAPQWVWQWLSPNKTFNRENLLSVSVENRREFLSELPKWDGHDNKYVSTNLANCNTVQEIAVVSGVRATLRISNRESCKDGIIRKPCGVVGFGKSDRTHIKTFKISNVPYSGAVYCVEMPKGTVIVRRNGKVSITGNCSQELRVLAELTKDPLLLKAFERGQDLHLSTANAIFNLGISDEDLCESSSNYHKIKDKYAKQRHIAKNGVLFPLIYGSTARGIAASLGCSESEAQGYIDAFFKAYPSVKRSIENCHKFLIRNGYVYNLTGRRRRFRKQFGKYPAKAFRQAYNFLIQGTSADMTKAAMVVLWRELKKYPAWDANIVITVHDEIVVECREEFASQCSALLASVMKSAYPLSRVALEVEVGIGRNYSEAK